MNRRSLPKSILLPLEFDLRAAGGIDRGLLQQFRREVDQPLVIRVRLVKLQHRELGIVVRREPLVAEVAIDLVDPLDAADHQPLQIQLRRDAQVQIDIERVVVRDERPRRRAAIERLHHRRLDFDKAALPRVAAAATR